MSVDPIINETQINIILDTNIPGEKPFSFTKNVLYNESLKNTNRFSTYPYFSYWIPYPEATLKEMDYPTLISFFFIKEVFLKVLRDTNEYTSLFSQMGNNIQKRDNNSLILKKIIKLDKQQETANIKKNIMIMLTLIFPTGYPTHNNILNSYDTYILGNININSSSIKDIIPFFLSWGLGIESTKQKYSYIRTPTKGICTVSQVIWLNDLYNHPNYKDIINNYENFKIWKTREIQKQDDDITNELELYEKNNIYEKTLNDFYERMKTIDINSIPEKKYDKRFETNIYPHIEIDKLKKKLDKLLKTSHIRDVDTLIDIKDTYNNIKEFIENKLYSVSNIDKLFASIKKIEVKNIIIKKYLNTNILLENKNETNNYNRYNTLDIYENKEKERVINIWGKGYNKYKEYINSLNIFNNSNSYSSNYSLQKTINNFITGNSTSQFEKLMIPSNDKNKNISELINTGITIKKNDILKNEIYVRMDVIGGKLTDKNVNKIKCMFDDKYLGNEFLYLINTNNKKWKVENERFFFDLNTLSEGKTSSRNKIRTNKNKMGTREQYTKNRNTRKNRNG